MLIFYILIGLIILKAISQYIKKERLPIITTKAKIIERRSHSFDSGGTDYYLLFELDTRYLLEFRISEEIYSKAPRNEWGTLTYQETRFLKYECNGRTFER